MFAVASSDAPAVQHGEAGYLALCIGESLNVLYKGSETKGDEGWLFGTSEASGEQGWFSEAHVSFDEGPHEAEISDPSGPQELKETEVVDDAPIREEAINADTSPAVEPYRTVPEATGTDNASAAAVATGTSEKQEGGGVSVETAGFEATAESAPAAAPLPVPPPPSDPRPPVAKRLQAPPPRPACPPPGSAGSQCDDLREPVSNDARAHFSSTASCSTEVLREAAAEVINETSGPAAPAMYAASSGTLPAAFSGARVGRNAKAPWAPASAPSAPKTSPRPLELPVAPQVQPFPKASVRPSRDVSPDEALAVEVKRIKACRTQDYRSVLGLPLNGANLETARSWYRQIMRLLHPDKRSSDGEALAGGREACEEAMFLVQAAIKQAEHVLQRNSAVAATGAFLGTPAPTAAQPTTPAPKKATVDTAPVAKSAYVRQPLRPPGEKPQRTWMQCLNGPFAFPAPHRGLRQGKICW